MLQDPAFFLGEKTLDGGIWHCVRSTDSHLTGNADLDRQGFPTAADNAVGKGMGYHKKLLLVDAEIYIQKRQSLTVRLSFLLLISL